MRQTTSSRLVTTWSRAETVASQDNTDFADKSPKAALSPGPYFASGAKGGE